MSDDRTVYGNLDVIQSFSVPHSQKLASLLSDDVQTLCVDADTPMPRLAQRMILSTVPMQPSYTTATQQDSSITRTSCDISCSPKAKAAPQNSAQNSHSSPSFPTRIAGYTKSILQSQSVWRQICSPSRCFIWLRKNTSHTSAARNTCR